MHSIFLFFSISGGVLAGLFFFPQASIAADSDIVITEIAAYEKLDHEWIEIYNKGSVPVDITDWKFIEDNVNHSLSAFRGDLTIDPGEYAVIADVAANTVADYPSFTGTLVDSSWQTLNESGELIGIKSKASTILEQFTYQSAPDGSLQRIATSINDYTAANWNESAPNGNTIGSPYSAVPPAPVAQGPTVAPQAQSQEQTQQLQQPQSEQPTLSGKIQSSWKPSRGDVVINEFVADPGDEPNEWVELYNNSPVPINIAGWFLEDGSRNVIPLKGILGVSGSARFAVFETLNAILNNSGDSITLRDANGAGIDSVSFGDWDDGVIENNAPRAQDPASVARFPDGYNSFSNATDFKATQKSTKRESNILIAEQSEDEKKTTTSSIVISELFPYPFSTQHQQEEFIELYNNGDTAIDLDGWRIVAGSVSYLISKKNASSTMIAAGAYVAIPRSVSTIALRNHGGETVTLFEIGNKKAVGSVSYKIDAPQNKSYARLENGEYAWTDTITSAAVNKITKANEPPYVALFAPLAGAAGEEIIFDASDTSDPDNDPLEFEWDFGDGSPSITAQSSMTHIYLDAGTYEVTVKVRAGTHEKIQTRHIAISDATWNGQRSFVSSAVIQKKDESSPSKPSVDAASATSSAAIVLNELLPNPAGLDRGQEFVELYNTGDTLADISHWIVDLQGGKTHYRIPQGSLVAAHGFFVIPAKGDGIVLRNGGDELVLRDWYDTVVDSVDYEESPEGKSFARQPAKDWVWTSVISRGTQNVIARENTNTVLKRISLPSAGSVVSRESATPTARIDRIVQLREIKQNTQVVVSGTVTVPPGVFDPKELYISDGKDGMLIKHTKDNLPPLIIGERVEVHGSLKKYVSGLAISLESASSIRKLSNGEGTVLQPARLSLQAITDDKLNMLAAISGEVIQVRWPHIYLKDATGEIRTYVKKSTGIDKMNLQKGQLVDVIGIVGKTASGYRILPRTSSDIVITGSRRVEAKESPEYTIVAARDGLASYGIAALVAIAAVSGGLFLQYYRRRKNE